MFKNSLEIKDKGYLYRSQNQIIFSEDELEDKHFQQLVKINESETNYEIVLNNIEKDQNGNICSPNTAWFLLKQSKMNIKFDKYKIHQGEIIKIGRIITRIKEIRFDKNKKSDKNLNNSISRNNNNSITNNKRHEYQTYLLPRPITGCRSRPLCTEGHHAPTRRQTNQ